MWACARARFVYPSWRWRCFAARSGRRSHYPPVWQADMPLKQMVVADFEHELGDTLGIRGGWRRRWWGTGWGISLFAHLSPDCLLQRSLFLRHPFFFKILPLNKTGANAGCSTFTTLKRFNLQKFQPLLWAGIFFPPPFLLLLSFAVPFSSSSFSLRSGMGFLLRLGLPNLWPDAARRSR